MNRRSWRSLLATVTLATLIGCQPGPSPIASGQPSGSASSSTAPSPTPTATPTIADCDALLGRLDAALADLETGLNQGGVGASGLASLLTCLGIAVIPPGTDAATLQAALDGTAPVVSAEVLDVIASAGTTGMLLDLDTLATDLANLGVVSAADGSPITRATLDAGMREAAVRDGADSAAARILLGLGRARVAVTGTHAPDALWGEARLDGVQSLILASAILVAPTSVTTGAIRLASVRTASGGSWLGGIPFRVRARSSIRNSRFASCILLHQYATKLLVDPEPTDLWHQGDPGPGSGTIGVTLVRKHLDDSVWLAAGCPPPSGGRTLGGGDYEAISGRILSFTPDAAAQAHGSLPTRSIRSTTDVDGHATVVYETIPEAADPADRIQPNETTEPATFEIAIDAGNFVPELPNTFVYSAPSKTKTITIHWYEPKGYKLIVDYAFTGTRREYAGDVALHGEIEMRPNEPPRTDGRPRVFFGTADLPFITRPQTGSCRFVWSGGGSLPTGAQAEFATPLDPATFKLTLGFNFKEIPRDTVTATACDPNDEVVMSSGKLSLLLLFSAGTWSGQTNTANFNVAIGGWTTSTEPGVLLKRSLRSSCGTPAICDFRGELRIVPLH